MSATQTINHWLLILLFGAVTTIAGAAENKPEAGFDFSNYAQVLSQYVDDNGLVNYSGLKTNRAPLDAFNTALSNVTEEDYAQWPDEAKIAFWINAYNALTLKSIVNHYPIQAGFLKSFAFPKNSIRQISGVWDTNKHSVMGKELTLDDIEHNVLRKEFQEPRIHFALVCAAKSCPKLRNEPYIASRLNEQLGDQTKHFISLDRNFHIDKSKNIVSVSSILQWYGEDFVPAYGAKDTFSHLGKSECAFMNFLLPYLSESQKDFLLKNKFRIVYNDYDWSLNEQ